MQERLGGEKLFALVNNAGIGGEDYDLLMKTNFYGQKIMTDTFLPLIAPNGRVVMVGSGSGPGYVGKLPEEEKAFWRNTNCTWKELAA